MDLKNGGLTHGLARFDRQIEEAPGEIAPQKRCLNKLPVAAVQGRAAVNLEGEAFGHTACLVCFGGK